MSRLMGPYTAYRAQQVADKLDVRHEILQTTASDPMRAKREIKEHLIQEHGYEDGTKNISSTSQEV